MIQSFLKAKHWQIFLLLVGTPILTQIALTSFMYANIFIQQDVIVQSELSYAYFFPYVVILVLLMLFMLFVFFGWQWSTVVGLQKEIPEEFQLKLTRFKIFFAIPIIYISLISLTFLFIALAAFELISIGNWEPSEGLMAGTIFFFVPLHIFSIFCLFHTLFFMAKTFKTAELQRATSFSDFAGEFFLFWFFPIGIWILQPKINRIVTEERDVLVDQLVE